MFRVFALYVLIQVHMQYMDTWLPPCLPVLCAAEQREGVVPAFQTCKQALSASVTIVSWTATPSRCMSQDQTFKPLLLQENSVGE